MRNRNHDPNDSSFSSIRTVGVMLIETDLLLWFTRRVKHEGGELECFYIRTALIIGWL